MWGLGCVALWPRRRPTTASTAARSPAAAHAPHSSAHMLHCAALLQVICGFGTTREEADALLAPQPEGTFVLRFGSQVWRGSAGAAAVLQLPSRAALARPLTRVLCPR